MAGVQEQVAVAAPAEDRWPVRSHRPEPVPGRLEGGFGESDALVVVEMLGRHGVDLIDISGGTYFPGAASSSDSGYSGLAVDDVSVSNEDDDTAQVIVTPASGLVTDEAGTTDAFTVTLTSLPAAAVTIPLSSSDPSEGGVIPSILTFTPENWDQTQTSTISAISSPAGPSNPCS